MEITQDGALGHASELYCLIAFDRGFRAQIGQVLVLINKCLYRYVYTANGIEGLFSPRD